MSAGSGTVFARPLQVVLEKGDDIERAIRRFTKRVKLEGTVKLAIERSSFTKPSEARRKKSLAARRRASSSRF